MATAPAKVPASAPVQAKYRYKEFTAYQFSTTTALAATLSTTLAQQIQAGIDFELMKLTYTADIAAAAQTDSTRVIPLVTCLIVDQGSQRALSGNNLPVPVPALFGTAEEPFVLPETRIFEGNSQIILQLNNYSAATSYNLQFTLHGRALWRNPLYKGT